MPETNKEFKILNIDNEEIEFRISGYEIIPYSNFRLPTCGSDVDCLPRKAKRLCRMLFWEA